MAAKEKKETLADSCPKQEVEEQENCGPCGATDCGEESDAGCDTCE